ncbi:MAG: hypothetical protein ABIR68_10220 [Ilumatobacteraceae bacterium]
MAKQGRPQIVEVIEVEPARRASDPQGVAPRRSVGERDNSPVGKPDRRRRWTAPLVVLAVASAVIVVAVASTSDSGPDRDVTPSPTAAAGRVAALALPVLPLVPATPAGYAVTSVTPGSIDDADAPSMVRELWATSTTSETSSWMEITATRTGDWAQATGDARVAVPAGIAVFDGPPQSLMTLTGPVPGGGATIVSSGVGRAAVQALFAQLRLVDGALVHDAPALGGTFSRIALDPDPSAIGAPDHDTRPTLTIAYSATTPVGQRRDDFDVTVTPVSGQYAEVARRFFLSHARTVVVHGQQAVLGNDVRTQDRQSVVFQRAGLQITIEGTAPRSVLLDAVDSLHVATGEELTALLATPPATPSAQPPSTVTWTTFATGRFADAAPWVLRAGADAGRIVAIDLGASGSLTAHAIAPVDPLAHIAGGDATIFTFASPALTALVAFVPPQFVGAQLVVTVDGVQHTAAPVELGDELVAGLAFDQLSRFTAQIITPDGRALFTTAG